MTDTKFKVGDRVKFGVETLTVKLPEPDADGDIVAMRDEGTYVFATQAVCTFAAFPTWFRSVAKDGSLGHQWSTLADARNVQPRDSIGVLELRSDGSTVMHPAQADRAVSE